MTTTQRFPAQVWTSSDLRSLKWGSMALGVTVGLFLPRGLRRYALMAAGAMAVKPLLALLQHDSVVITNDRPLHVDPPRDEDGEPASFETAFESAERPL